MMEKVTGPLQHILPNGGGRQNKQTHRKQGSSSTFLVPDEDDMSPIQQLSSSSEQRTKFVIDHTDQQRAMDPSEKIEFLLDMRRDEVAEEAQRQQRPTMMKALGSRGLDLDGVELPGAVDLDDEEDRLTVASDVTLNLELNRADSKDFDDEDVYATVDDQSIKPGYSFDDDPLESASYFSIMDKIQTKKIEWMEELERQDALKLQREIEHAERKQRRKEELAWRKKQREVEAQQAPSTPTTTRAEESDSEDNSRDEESMRFHRLGSHIFFDM